VVTPAFTVAPADERALGLSAYLVGFVELLVVVVAFAYVGHRVRRALLPGWRGAPAALAAVVLASVAVVLVAQLIGTFGAFGEAELIVGALGTAALAAVVCGRVERRRGLGPAPAPPKPGHSAVAVAVALVICAAVVAAWTVPTLSSLAGGMDRADTLWYHMPLAAKWVQTGSLAEIFFFDPIFFATFYPAHSEIFHAVPILAFDRDIVSPLINLGFLAIGLLAGWCIGRPYGVAPQALIGAAAALGTQMLVEFQAGEALNDITGVAFVLAAAALLVNGYAARSGGSAPAREISGGALAVAGLAAGLAIGMKLSFLAPVAALTVGVVFIARAGSRVRTAALWTLPLALAGAYWYVRNAIDIGNPIPYIASLGPIDLPAPERAFQLRPGHSIAYYWNDLEIWWDWFIPGLDESFGDLWPLTLVALLAGACWAIWRGGEPVLRMLGAVALFTAIAYLFTPLTAAGEEGQPIAFVWNVRYIAPAVAIALALLPCLPAARATPGGRLTVGVVLTFLAVATVASLVQWEQGHVKGAVAAGIAVVVLGAALAWLRSRGFLGPAARRRWVVAMATVAVLGAAAAGWWEQNHYLERRYENTSPRLQLAKALRWARDIRDARIAVAGIRGVFNQYPLYGTDLSNEVQWLGIRGDHDAWLRIPTCERWREEVNAGGYTHVVTTYDPFHPGRLTDTKEAVWTREDPATRVVLKDGPVSVFHVDGPMDPDGCAGLPELSPAELNGDSVNNEPLANQPPGTGPLQAGLLRGLRD